MRVPGTLPLSYTVFCKVSAIQGFHWSMDCLLGAMANALLVIVVVLALTSAGCSKDLRLVFWNITRHRTDIEGQLKLILDVGQELVKWHISTHSSTTAEELGQALRPVCSSDKPDVVMEAARAALAPLRRFAGQDAIAAVLARRIILACITLHRHALLDDTEESVAEQFFADVAREV
jgi:hypothetical protein